MSLSHICRCHFVAIIEPGTRQSFVDVIHQWPSRLEVHYRLRASLSRHGPRGFMMNADFDGQAVRRAAHARTIPPPFLGLRSMHIEIPRSHGRCHCQHDGLSRHISTVLASRLARKYMTESNGLVTDAMRRWTRKSTPRLQEVFAVLACRARERQSARDHAIYATRSSSA